MIDLKLKQPNTTDDKEITSQLEKLALECSMHINPNTREEYCDKVLNWINDFTGDLAFRKQKYIRHYIFSYNKYLKDKLI